jgi:hypothetical protein
MEAIADDPLVALGLALLPVIIAEALAILYCTKAKGAPSGKPQPGNRSIIGDIGDNW